VFLGITYSTVKDIKHLVLFYRKVVRIGLELALDLDPLTLEC
jgi:hypothetical protein